MKKNIIEIIVTSLLIIGLIFAISNVFKRAEKRKAKAKPAIVTAAKIKQKETGIAPAAEVVYKDLESRAEELKWGRDPFAYISSGIIGTTTDLKLDGIVWDKDNPKAMINGVIVSTGEKIGDYTIIDITNDSVILTDGTNEIKLKL